MTQDPTKSPAVSEREAIARDLYWADVKYDDTTGNILDEWRDRWWQTQIEMPLSGPGFLKRWFAIADAALISFAPASEIVVTEDQCERVSGDWQQAVEVAAEFYSDDYPDDRDIRIACRGIERGRCLARLAPAPEQVVREADRASGYNSAITAIRGWAAGFYDEANRSRLNAVAQDLQNNREEILGHPAFAQPEAARVGGLREARCGQTTAKPYILPCDVHLPPATVIRAGCTLETLKIAMEVEHRPKTFDGHPRNSLPLATQPAAGSEG